MSNEIKRMHYFNGLLLKDEDFALEQNYHMKLQRLHNRHFHDWGIVDGLEVNKVAGYAQVTVSQGFAINRIVDSNTNEKFSQEIWICDNHPDNPVNLADCTVDTDIYITVTYEEAEADIDSKKGGDNYIHIWERARINVVNKLPADPSKEIVLARVRLKTENGIKVVEDVYYVEKDGITQIRKYAVTQGTAQEFAKVSIGEKDKLNLPYIDGSIDKTLGQSDGLEIHSPFVKVPGTLVSGPIKAKGDVEITGGVTVTTNNNEALKVDSKGDVYITKAASVGGMLSSSGGMNVSGTNTKLDTTNVEMTSNMLTINKYTPKTNEIEPRKQSSGIDVFRGGNMPDAKLLWDESKGSWMAGTDKRDDIPDSGLSEIAYGATWKQMHDGSNVDLLHKHSNIYDASGKSILAADTDSNIGITNSLKVSGSIVAQNGIEAPTSDLENIPKIAWSEDKGRWQIGAGETMYDIPYGTTWEELTTGVNADALHTHSEFYYNNQDLAMSVGPTGDIDVVHNLNVSKDLFVDGNLTVLGTTTEYKNKAQVVTENVVIVNKPDNGGQPISEGGLEVYRGENIPNARLIWDEGSDSWKIGTGESMSDLPSGIEWEYLTHGEFTDDLHKHKKLFAEDGSAAVEVSGTDDVNVAVRGALTVDDNADITGNMAVDGSVTIKGNLTVSGTETVINKKVVEVDNNIILVNKYTAQSEPVNNEGGLEVYRGGTVPNARIVWNEEEEKWKVSTGEITSDLPYGKKWDTLTQKAQADSLHIHSTLSDKDGKAVVGVNTSGNVVIQKDTNVKGELSVEGSATILGDLDVLGTATYVNKVDMTVTDSTILLNNYEGDTSPVNESGIEIFRGSSPKARMVWDEAAKTWKSGIGDDLKELAGGSAWDTLKGKGNADALHNHGQLYNEKGDILALSTRASGNVDVVHDLKVGQDLTIDGNLDVRGGLTRINSKNIEVVGNSITLNRFDSGVAPEVDSGISVFRGSEKNASIVWDEKNDYWKLGLQNSSSVLKVKNDGSIQTVSATIDGELAAGSANINGTLTVKDGIEVDRLTETKASLKWNEAGKQWRIGTIANTTLSATADGCVGIGKENPLEKLDVGGNAVINGNMDVTGNAEVTGSLTSENVDVRGNLTVGGAFEMNGTLEVQRGVDSDGKPLPAARIFWDETKDAWTFGTEGNMDEIILNSEHRHNNLYTDDKKSVSLKTDSLKNVEMLGNAVIDGNVITKGFFEVLRGTGSTAAQISWNEEKDVWQAGIEGSLKDIVLGDHKHNCLYSSNNTILSVSVDSSGNVAIGKKTPEVKLDVEGAFNALSAKISGGLEAGGTVKAANTDITGLMKAESATITKDLTVEGNLTVNGEVVTVNTTTLDVEDNIVTINKYAPQALPTEKNAGLEIFRGGTVSNAQIMWNETTDSWQAGTADNLKNICYSDHTHDDLTAITGAMTVSSGNIGIGVAAPTEKLAVSGNAVVSGNISSANANIGTKLTAASADISGSLAVSRGMEILGDATKPQIVWDSTNKVWQAGTSSTLKNISLSDHTHTELTTITGAMTVSSGNIGIGVAAPTEKLAVSGNAAISGNITAANANIGTKLTAVNADISGSLTVSKGMEILGDATKPQIVWNSTNKVWQAGTSSVLKNISLSDHTHTELTTITGAMTVSSGNIGIGVAAPTEKLAVSGNAAISGRITAANADIGTKLTAASADISGSLSVSKGIEILGDATKPQVVWDSTNKVWQAGTSSALKNISLSDHTHTELTAITGAMTVSSGNIGIGVAAPTEKLAVSGNVAVSGNITAANAEIGTKLTAANADISGNLIVSKGIGITGDAATRPQIIWDSTNSKWQFGTADKMLDIENTGHQHQKLYASKDVEALVIDSTGNIGIGKAPETGIKLLVNGDVKANNIAQGSSRTFKNNIEKLPVKTALDLLNKLNPVSFDYKINTSKKHNIGFIAEEVPEIFTTSDNKAIALMDIIGVLTAVVKKQQKDSKTMQKQITDLQKQVAASMGA